ncbi:hypothetical protein BGZ80_006215 [Entomortierella chlamydospora]|uniref:FAD-binding domain-containing protein n=1 Tax=Entomortierella chlamydospora TaxID=101097 RepID=A0A9P6N0B3_9FUNG|nr:hypothetical protein BGZ80_006215 [Entomortierella chlamydospora]
MPPAKLKVLISGGGIAGLTLAILLERAGIDYEVFERATDMQSLESALSIGPNVLPMFEQLGLLENLLALAKENDYICNFNEDMQLTSTISYLEFPKRTGYADYVIARPDFYNLLYSQLPKERIHMGKRVASLEQHDASNSSGMDDTGGMKRCSGGVTITFTDNTTAHGDILVGSDGAYSSWITLTLPNNKICWIVIEHLQDEMSRTAIEANVEWGPGAADAMIEKVRDFPIPSGAEGMNLTLADLIDETPRELISRVPLEGKMYPSGSQGANTAVQDAIVLANYINAMSDSEPDTIEKAFESYHRERVGAARIAYETSERLRHLFRRVKAT